MEDIIREVTRAYQENESLRAELLVLKKDIQIRIEKQGLKKPCTVLECASKPSKPASSWASVLDQIDHTQECNKERKKLVDVLTPKFEKLGLEPLAPLEIDTIVVFEYKPYEEAVLSAFRNGALESAFTIQMDGVFQNLLGNKSIWASILSLISQLDIFAKGMNLIIDRVNNHELRISVLEELVSGLQTTVSEHTTTLATHSTQISTLTTQITTLTNSIISLKTAMNNAQLWRNVYAQGTVAGGPFASNPDTSLNRYDLPFVAGGTIGFPVRIKFGGTLNGSPPFVQVISYYDGGVNPTTCSVDSTSLANIEWEMEVVYPQGFTTSFTPKIQCNGTGLTFYVFYFQVDTRAYFA